ncbi:MAG: hypothetical protein DRQ08_04785 [Candidatus Latescibacterota bacterium]|nr:MAG: hypothetical protein DRQ08_04785 [Candidatus Latescibacterota bacterium]
MKEVKADRGEIKRPISDSFEVFQAACPEHRKAIDFLRSWTPPEDLEDLDAEVLIEHVEYSYIAKETVPWGSRIGEELFFGYVLPYRTWAEPIERWRKLLYSELYPLVGRSEDPVEAAMEENRWAAGKAHFEDIPVTYKSPLRTMADGCGDCIDLSIFLVAACRSVGIPARGVFSPWMPLGHDGTHMWTEIWGGKWHYLGSCEPERVPDRAWFSMHIKRAAKVYALSFRGTGSMLGLGYCPDVWVEDVTERYTTVGTLRAKVTADGTPVPGCRLYVLVPNSKNELVLVASSETDAQGSVEMKLGSQVELYFVCAGDLRKNCGQFVYIDTGRTEEVHLKM